MDIHDKTKAAHHIQQLIDLGNKDQENEINRFLKTIMPVVGTAMFDSTSRTMIEMMLLPVVKMMSDRIEQESMGDDKDFDFKKMKHKSIKPDMDKLIKELIKPENRA
tara:strand:+ start:5446 stop:5766 length:321 start_codon:yes stop_codon:yes gene_type:complete